MLPTLPRRAVMALVLCGFVLTAPQSVTASVSAKASLGALSAGRVDAQGEADYVEALAARQLHDEVIREARAFLAAHAKHEAADRVRYRLAGALEAKGSADEACAEYERLCRRDRFSFVNAARLRFARCELSRGEEEAARRAGALCDQVAQEGGAELLAPALLLGGEAWRRAKRPELAVRALSRLVALEDLEEETRFEAAHSLAAAAYEMKDGERA
ncbi:MAG: hypothetical protein AAF368_05255, partial [Planctomycetota bacterium]